MTAAVLVRMTVLSGSQVYRGNALMNAFGTEHIALQVIMLALGALAFTVITVISYNKACGDFERIDL